MWKNQVNYNTNNADTAVTLCMFHSIWKKKTKTAEYYVTRAAEHV